MTGRSLDRTVSRRDPLASAHRAYPVGWKLRDCRNRRSKYGQCKTKRFIHAGSPRRLMRNSVAATGDVPDRYEGDAVTWHVEPREDDLSYRGIDAPNDADGRTIRRSTLRNAGRARVQLSARFGCPLGHRSQEANPGVRGVTRPDGAVLVLRRGRPLVPQPAHALRMMALLPPQVGVGLHRGKQQRKFARSKGSNLSGWSTTSASSAGLRSARISLVFCSEASGLEGRFDKHTSKVLHPLDEARHAVRRFPASCSAPPRTA